MACPVTDCGGVGITRRYTLMGPPVCMLVLSLLRAHGGQRGSFRTFSGALLASGSDAENLGTFVLLSLGLPVFLDTVSWPSRLTGECWWAGPGPHQTASSQPPALSLQAGGQGFPGAPAVGTEVRAGRCPRALIWRAGWRVPGEVCRVVPSRVISGTQTLHQRPWFVHRPGRVSSQ